ncbi:MAG: hypothetical protein C4302_09440, partial [Thermus sp.]
EEVALDPRVREAYLGRSA